METYFDISNDLKDVWDADIDPVLCALHFYGHGSYQKSVASDCYLGLSQPSICRAIEQITAALNRRAVLAKWVVLPNAQERRANIEKNYEQFGLPGVYGYVDGFHIHIMAPPRPLRENNFVNRKSRHSINAQMEMQDAVLDSDSEMSDWLIERDSKCGVVLHDRLMTDAALGAVPIKTEHSYSLHSDDSAPNSPTHTKVDDMEDECYPTIPASAWSRRRSTCSPLPGVKSEPKSEPESPASSCPPSPVPGTPVTQLDYVIDHTTGTIHMPQAVLQKVGAAGVPQLLLSSAPRLVGNKLSIKVTSSGASGFTLPPTPPSSLSSSDSEGALSPSHDTSPPAAVSPPARRSHLYVSHHSSRQPINTPLISSQPKGSTGTLILTDEEKRTLLAEGYPVPTRLPLTKAEEKSLKKIRRKIKNKISAQESRRKKKEYMDQLERKVELLLSENNDYRKRVESLEQSNAKLLSQLAAVQALTRARK